MKEEVLRATDFSKQDAFRHAAMNAARIVAFTIPQDVLL